MFFAYTNNSSARFNQTVHNLACCLDSAVQSSLLWTNLAVKWVNNASIRKITMVLLQAQDTANLHFQRPSVICF